MLKTWLRIALGVVLVFLGVLGVLLPVIPGFVFLIPGLVILAEYFPPIRRLVDWAKRKAAGKPASSGDDGSSKQNT